MNIEILENSADFNTDDFNDLMLSIGWTKQEFIDAKPKWSMYNMFRSYDYFAIAKVDNKTVGVLEAFSDRDNFANSFLYFIAVHKDYQRKGIGRALMRAFNKHFKHTTTWAVVPCKDGIIDGDDFLGSFGFKHQKNNFDLYSRFRNTNYNKTAENKEIKLENLEILENCADFNPKDIDEIQLSIDWTEQKYLDLKPNWAIYDVLRNVDYYAIAKINGKAVGLLEAFTDRDNFHTSYLYSIMVHKDYQRKGVGSALMKAFNEKFSHTTTWVITPKHKADGATNFLEKFGFKDSSESFTVFSRKRNNFKID